MTVWEEIEAIPRLSREEEAELGRRISAGSERAVTRLVEANLHVATPIAKAICRKAGGKWEAGDMLSEATQALMAAAHRWDHTSAVRFGAYARLRVRGAMKDFLRKKADVVRGSQQQAISLDEEDSEGISMIDGLESHEPEEEHSPLEGLSKTEREILQRRVMQPVPDSVEEVAKALGVSADYVRRVQTSAVIKLRQQAA